MLKAYGWGPIAASFGAARERHPKLADLFTFYEAALRLVHETPVEIDLSGLEPSRLQLRLVQGEPLLSRERFVVDLAATEALFERLADLVAARGPEPAEAVRRIRELGREGALTVEALVRGALDAPGAAAAAASRLGVDADVLGFLTRFSLWPSLEACASGVDEWVSAIGWDHNVCPACGSGAGLAELKGDEGMRVLHCSFCAREWAFQRTGCPYCGNVDHNRLEILYADRDTRAHLSVCHACRAYLKTIDNKEYRGLIPAVEDLVSPYLDILAGEKGYERIVF
ncbi:MAG TPA: formate dehydrogenase accessory protein FdhE [Thermodesulfobacteriota bacterium]